MPDCHMQSDSSTFHTVNPGEKMERQKDGEREGAEGKQKQEGDVKMEKWGEDSGETQEWDIITSKWEGDGGFRWKMYK